MDINLKEILGVGDDEINLPEDEFTGEALTDEEIRLLLEGWRKNGNSI